jgi:predicted TIM-barrel fold metal-dependent hydrolase
MEKISTLKIVSHHCGAMLPFFAARFQAAEETGPGEIMKLTKPPVEYFKRFMAILFWVRIRRR